MQIEIRHLQMIRAIDREGSMTLAAEALGVTQSALSHQLREIEDRLRTPLFHRVNRRLLLTDSGKRFLASANSVLDELDRLETDIAAVAAGREGRIRVSTECYTSYRWVPQVLRAFRAQWPSIDVLISPEHTHDVTAALLDGSIDVAIMHSEPDESFTAVPVLRDEMMIVTGLDHPFARRRFIEPADLRDEHLVLHGPIEKSGFARNLLVPANVRPRQVSEVQLTEAIVEVVSAGIGVAPMANWVAADSVAAGKVAATRITRNGYQRVWHAVTLASEQSPRYVREFVQILRSNAAAFVGLPPQRQLPRLLDRRAS
jgi:LysR family transcriptional regulator for metE and metH